MGTRKRPRQHRRCRGASQLPEWGPVMTALWLIIAGACACAAGFLAGQVLGYKAGHAAGRDTERTRQSLKRLDDAAVARKAAAQPPPAPPGDPAWDKRAPFPVYMAPGRAVTAADIRPVTVPEPKLTDTGELRRIASRGEEIRARLTGSFTAPQPVLREGQS